MKAKTFKESAVDFDKTLTKQELESKTYLEWSDKTIGRLVRHMAEIYLEQDIKGFKGVSTMAACYALIHFCSNVSAGSLNQTIEQVSIGEKELGDWEVIVRKKAPNS